MEKSLANAMDCEEIRRRIASLTSHSSRLWGEMSVGGMICHLDDAYQVALGERVLDHPPASSHGQAIKEQALHSPLPWDKNMKASPEVRQGAGGTPPSQVERDRARLLDTLARFVTHPNLQDVAHPSYGSMTRNDWLRWGYLHADHHLRQFSA